MPDSDPRNQLQLELIAVNSAIGAAIVATNTFDVDALYAALDAMTNHTERARGFVPALPMPTLPLTLPLPEELHYAQGADVSYRLPVSGGTQPYNFIWSGNMPANLTLDSTGLLSGTLIAAPGQQFVVNVMVLDKVDAFSTGTLVIRVAP